MTGSANAAGRSAPLSPLSALLIASLASAIVAAVAGLGAVPLDGATTPPERLLVAAGAVAVAQLARIFLRIGSDGVTIAWGEAGAIVALCVVPVSWVPAAALLGSTVAHAYRAVGADGPARARIGYGIGVLTLGGTTAAGVALALGADPAVPVPIGPNRSGELILLGLAGLGYFATTSLLTSIWVARVQHSPYVQVWLHAARGKRLMLLGNLAIGLAVGLLVSVDLRWLLALPPFVWLLHQAYVHRLHGADQRRIWEVFAEAARGLSQHDEQAVVAAGLGGATRLFRPDLVEIVVLRPSGRRRRYISGDGSGDGSGGRTGDRSGDRFGGRSGDRSGDRSGGRSGDRSGGRSGAEGHTLVRRLAGPDKGTPPGLSGEIRLRFRRPVRLAAWEQHAFSAYADALSSALHDAAAHRQLRAMAARSAYEAVHDPLTGLPNRSTLLARGNAELVRMAPGTPVALLLFDVDGFKEVNDTLSHSAGDELLQVLARRLLSGQGEGELLGRLGGDEYGVLLTGPDGYPMERAKQITTALARTAEVSGITLAVAVSAGVVVAEAGGCDMAELLRRADVALYQAKRGGISVSRYDPAQDAASTDRLALLAELRDALATTEQIVLVLQPTVDLATGAPTGAEALARWRHPRRGTLAPAEFIAAIDNSDLVGGFTWYVLDRALAIAAGWAAQGLDVPIAVNLSARSLLDPELPAVVVDRLRAHGVAPERLIVEITETVMMPEPGAVEEPAVIDEVLAALRRIGVQVSVDDFGTGYSSLAFLTRVPVDEVKIDRTFVAMMADSPEAAAIVRTTVDLARELGLRVVAEGVETAEQRAALTDLGATAAQGFLFHPAMDVDQATALLLAGVRV